MTAAKPTLSGLIRIYPFNLLIGARAVAASGQWMERTAIGWIAWDITGSAAALGLIGLLRFGPGLLLTFLGGALSDRHSAIAMLKMSKLATVAIHATMAAILLLGAMDLFLLGVLVFAIGAAQSLAAGPNKAIIWHVVPKDYVPLAIPFNSVVHNGATFAGPVLAGVSIAANDSATVFVLTTIINIAFLGVLFLFPANLGRSDRERAQKGPKAIVQEMWASLKHVRGDRFLGPVILFQLILALSFKPLLHLFPGFNAEVLNGDAVTLGLLTGLHGMGGILVGLVIAGRTNTSGPVTLMACIAGGAFFAAGASVSLPWLTFLLIFFAGGAAIIRVAGIQTLIQLQLRDDMRGRVMSLYILTGEVGMALGSLILGLCAQFIGMAGVYILAGVTAVCTTILFWPSVMKGLSER